MSNPWSAISKPSSEFNVRLVSDDHPLKLFWGIDSKGQYLFIVDAPKIGLPEKNALPNLAGIKTAIATEGERGKLVLLLNEKLNWELFYALCSDLVRSTSTIKNESSGGAIILRRLQRWQEFLRKERLEILPVEKIKGLIGELLFMRDTIAVDCGWDDAVVSWKGPEDAPQDFAIHDTAVEVKCQSGSSRPTVRVSSVEQLNPQLPKGFLVVYTLATADRESPDAFTLNEIVASIRAALVSCSESSRERFEDLIYLAGYIYSEKYDEFIFQRIALKCFKIEDGFPRLKAADVPDGIDKVTYNLSLDACASFEAQLKLERANHDH